MSRGTLMPENKSGSRDCSGSLGLYMLRSSGKKFLNSKNLTDMFVHAVWKQETLKCALLLIRK